MMIELEKIGGLLIKLDDLLYFDENDRPSKKLTNTEYDNLKKKCLVAYAKDTDSIKILPDSVHI